MNYTKSFQINLMKIFIDIGHPAHVHYFKNFIWIMQEKGHTIFISARDKEVTLDLLDYYKLPYFNRGKGRKGLVGKLIYILEGDRYLLKQARKVKPDLFLSFGSPYAAHVAWLMRKPHIAFDDTDHSFFEHFISLPFTKTILTPIVFQKDFGKKQIRFDGFMELCALHPNRFKPKTENVADLLNNTTNSRYVILRFVSWQASHDIGLHGLSLEDKYLLVEQLSKYATVLISSEEKLPDDLSKYAYKVHPALMHDVLNGASLIVSESLTMAAEAAFLGTPSVCISTALAGTLDEEVKLGLIELFRTSDGIIERVVEIMKDAEFKQRFKIKSRGIIKDKIDVTAFMVWFIENYPDSFNKMQKEPEYQLRFK
jgi:predicted glycosyltransferase